MNIKLLLIPFLASMFVYQYAVEQNLDELEKAYRENSPSKLKRFLDKWADENKPITNRELENMDKIVDEGYQVFESFYDPHALEARGGSQFGNDYYLDTKYFLVQNSLNIYRSDKIYYTDSEIREYVKETINNQPGNDRSKKELIDRFNSKSLEQSSDLIRVYGPHGSNAPDSTQKLVKSIDNFRPRIKNKTIVPLYYTEKYDRILKKFMLQNRNKDVVLEANSFDLKKQNFLANYIKIHRLSYNTPPYVLSVVFDREMEYAMVKFSMINEGGDAYLKKEKGKWNLLSAKVLWKN